MTTIYYCNISDFEPERDIRYLSDFRKAKMLNLTQPKDQLRSLVAGLMMSAFLGRDYDTQIAYTKYGKPYLRNHNPEFNLSHSGDYVVMAVAPRNVGVDVQQIRTYHPGIIKKCLTPKEQDWLKEQSGPEAFFQIWTGKESIMKYTGEGFRLNPSGFSVLPVENRTRMVFGEPLYLFWHTLVDHIICVAAEDEDLQMQSITRQALLSCYSG